MSTAGTCPPSRLRAGAGCSSRAARSSSPPEASRRGSRARSTARPRTPTATGISIRFALDPFPTWRYEAEGFQIERTIGLLRERSVTVVRYRNTGPTESVSLRPAAPAVPQRAGAARGERRDRHSVEIRGEVSWVRPAAYLPRLYPARRRRGDDEGPDLVPATSITGRTPRGARRRHEDLWSPLRWRWTLAPGADGCVLFSRDEIAGDPALSVSGERQRRERLGASGDPSSTNGGRAEDFLVDGDDRVATILAGFPGLGDRGRDAMSPRPASRSRQDDSAPWRASSTRSPRCAATG